MQATPFCPPSGVNDAAGGRSSAKSGQRAGTQRLSNLDLNGKLVKKGRLVSWHGMRYGVLKVSRGRCLGVQTGLFGVATPGAPQVWLVCETLQVVA